MSSIQYHANLYTIAEDEFIIEHAHEMTVAAIAKRLNKTDYSIKSRADRLRRKGFKINFHNVAKATPSQINERKRIAKEMRNRGATHQQVADRLMVSLATARRLTTSNFPPMVSRLEVKVGMFHGEVERELAAKLEREGKHEDAFEAWRVAASQSVGRQEHWCEIRRDSCRAKLWNRWK